jgi:hypothetical protein
MLVAENSDTRSAGILRRMSRHVRGTTAVGRAIDLNREVATEFVELYIAK